MRAGARHARGLAAAATAAAAAVLAGACTEPASDEGPAIISGVARLEVPMSMNRNLDLLFVIDNSPGMASQQAKLLASYRSFIAVLETLQGGLPDLHIGVVTTDVGTRGAYDAGPGPSIGAGPGACTSDGDRGELRRAAAVDGNFLSDSARPDGTHERSYTGSLADAFVQLADVGAAGCTYARPLEAMRRALGNPANAGFLRDDAYLGVVLLTNDDDCSFGSAAFTGGELDRARCAANAGALVAVDEYVAALGAAKDPSQVLVMGGFLPPDQPACADARPAARLAALLGGFPNRSHAVSICEQDLSGVLSPLARPSTPVSAPPCFIAPLLDVDPVADGLQPECDSWFRYVYRGEAGEERLPRCVGDGPGPCWQIGREPGSCPAEVVEFRDLRRFSGEALAIIECVTR